MSAPITFSQRALDHIRKLRTSMKLNDDTYLRIGIKGGKGCMGVEKLIGFDSKNDQDELFEVEGVHVVIRKGESLYIAGMEVDYLDEGNSHGFLFKD